MTSDVCASCGRELRQIQWNSACDLMVCDNPFCLRYRSPARTILTERGEKKRNHLEGKAEKARAAAVKHSAAYRARKKAEGKGA